MPKRGMRDVGPGNTRGTWRDEAGIFTEIRTHVGAGTVTFLRPNRPDAGRSLAHDMRRDAKHRSSNA
jgi:hypothetical protein